MFAYLIFNRVKTALNDRGQSLNEFIYVNFKTKKIIIDNVEIDFSKIDLSEVSKYIKDIDELLLTKKEITVKTITGEKIKH